MTLAVGLVLYNAMFPDDTECNDDAGCTMLKYGKCGTTAPKKCMCDATKAVVESNVCKRMYYFIS